MGIPNTVYLRASDVFAADVGVTRYLFYAAVRARRLRGVKFPGAVRCKYRREDVVRVFGLADGERKRSGV